MSLESRLTRLERDPASAAGRCASCADRPAGVRLVRWRFSIPHNYRNEMPTKPSPDDPADAEPCRCGWRPAVVEVGELEIYEIT